MTKIKELTTGQGNVEVEAKIKEFEEIKTFNKYGKELRLRNALIEDDSGSVKLTLWNDDVERFEIGDKIKIIKGYVGSFQDEKQLTAGKFGSIEKLEKDGEAKAEPAEEVAEEVSEEPTEEVAEESSEESADSAEI